MVSVGRNCTKAEGKTNKIVKGKLVFYFKIHACIFKENHGISFSTYSNKLL